ncbi:MAG: discoidin domain-containing protein [Prevotellaceae bacterium]|nr:discoidin domain-containing protein [Candidatus Faecinaster equi]
MKKFLLLVALVSFSAIWNASDARWNKVRRLNASECVPKVGQKVAITAVANSNFEGRFLTTDPKTGKCIIGKPNVIDDDCIWEFEEGVYNEMTGSPTVCIKQVSTGKYIVPFTANWDGFTLSDDIIGAANYQVLSCGEDIPWSNMVAWPPKGTPAVRKPGHEEDPKDIGNWGENAAGKLTDENSVGFAFYDGSIDDEEEDAAKYNYLAVWFGPQVINWGYTDTNQWDVWEVEFEANYQQELEELVEMYESEFTPVGGSLPGCYLPEYAQTYNEALEWAMLASLMDDMGNDFYISAMNDLKQARIVCEDNIIPLTEGYYTIVSGWDDVLNLNGYEIAAYANEGYVRYGVYNQEDVESKFVWKITPTEDPELWNVQHVMTDQYTGEGSGWYNSNCNMLDDPEHPMQIKLRFEGKWWMTAYYRSSSQTSWTPQASSSPSATGIEDGKMTSWGAWNDGSTLTGFNSWVFRPVSEEVLNKVNAEKEQYAKNKELKSLRDEVAALYPKLFSISTTEDSLITVASQITSNSPLTEGTVPDNLIDGDELTYLHTNPNYTNEAHFLQVDLSEYSANALTFVYDKRRGSNQELQWGEEERPAMVSIYAAVDTTDGGTWTKITESYQADEPLPAKLSCVFGPEYKYVRFVNEMNKRGDNVLTLSAFQVFNAILNKEKSQYYSVAGMQEAAEKMMEVKADKDSVVTATDKDIEELRTALEAVKQMFSDPDVLQALIDECETMSENISIGVEIGELPEDKAELVENLKTAVNNAKEVLEKYSTDKTKFNAALNELTEAKDAIFANLSFIEEGKWYFIINADQTRAGEAGTDDAMCNGNAIYAVGNEKDANIDWGYSDGLGSLTTVNDPKTMWTFKKVEGTDYYYIQNMISGIYLGGYNGRDSKVTNSLTPVPYKVSFLGSKQFTLCPISKSNRKNDVLYAAGGEKTHVTCGVAQMSNPGAWTFTEVTEELTGGGIVLDGFAYNLTDVFAVPFAHEDLAEYNEGCHWYRIKKLVGDEENGYTAVELTEGTSFEAGESSIYIGGELGTEQEYPFEAHELMVPMPEAVVDHAWSGAACNGILGQPNGLKCPAGSGCSDGKTYFPFTSESGVGCLTGVINPKDYQGAKEDWTTDATIEFRGKLTGTKSVKKNTQKTVKNVIGVNAVAGKFIVPGVYIQEGKKIVE